MRAQKRKPKSNRKVLSAQEIYRRYPSEWVLIENPISDTHLNLIRGKVVFHSKDRLQFDRKLMELRLRRAATVFTGDPSGGTELVL